MSDEKKELLEKIRSSLAASQSKLMASTAETLDAAIGETERYLQEADLGVCTEITLEYTQAVNKLTRAFTLDLVRGIADLSSIYAYTMSTLESVTTGDAADNEDFRKSVEVVGHELPIAYSALYLSVAEALLRTMPRCSCKSSMEYIMNTVLHNTEEAASSVEQHEVPPGAKVH